MPDVGSRAVMAIGLLQCDRELTITDAGSKACRLLRRRRDELVGLGLDDFVELDDATTLERLAVRLEDQGLGATMVDARAFDRSGVPRPVRLTLAFLPGSATDTSETGEPPASTFLVGLQPLQSATLDLERLEQTASALAERVPDLIVRYRLWPERGFEYVSSSSQELLGYPPSAFYANPELLHQLVVDPAELEMLLAVYSGKWQPHQPITLHLLHRDGQVRALEQRPTAVLDGERRLLAIESISRDVTDRLDEQLELSTVVAIRRRLDEATAEHLDTADPVEVLQVAIDAICTHLGWPIGHAVLPDADPAYFTSAPTWHVDDPDRFIRFRMEIDADRWPADGDLVADLVMLAEPVVTTVTDDGRAGRLAAAAACGLTHSVALPVGVGDGIGAVLEFYTEDPEPPTAPVVAALADVADEIGRLLAISQKMGTFRRKEEVRQEFVSRAAHELRGPIGSIALMASALAGQAPDSDPALLASSLRALASQADRITAMTNNLLALSQLEEDRVDVHLEAVSVRRVAYSAMSSLVPDHGAQVEIRVPDDLKVMADVMLLDQVLANLLVNSCRHGGPDVEVTVEASWSDEEVLITVADDGPGLPAEVLAGLFGPMRQPLATQESSGLGLALVHQMVLKMNGQVVHVPNEPSGARFLIRLPLA